MVFRAPGYKFQPDRHLKSDDARRVLEAKPGEQVAVSVLFSDIHRDNENGSLYLQPHFFAAADLLITREERDRFEAKHSFNGWKIRVRRFWMWLRDAENEKALKIVGGVAAALAVAL